MAGTCRTQAHTRLRVSVRATKKVEAFTSAWSAACCFSAAAGCDLSVGSCLSCEAGAGRSAAATSSAEGGVCTRDCTKPALKRRRVSKRVQFHSQHHPGGHSTAQQCGAPTLEQNAPLHTTTAPTKNNAAVG